jgi:hypothetical protein
MKAHEELASKDTTKNIFHVVGRVSVDEDACTPSVLSGNMKCPFCNSDRGSKAREEQVADMMKRVAVNDAGAICMSG